MSNDCFLTSQFSVNHDCLAAANSFIAFVAYFPRERTRLAAGMDLDQNDT